MPLELPDPTDSRHTYLQVADNLRKRISEREFLPGQVMPSQPDIAAAYEVGIQTAREAYAVLRKEGLIDRQRGQGFRVAEPAEIETVTLAAGETVRGRVSGPAERKAHGIREGTYILVVASETGEKVYPADRTEIQVRSASE